MRTTTVVAPGTILWLEGASCSPAGQIPSSCSYAPRDVPGVCRYVGSTGRPTGDDCGESAPT